MPLPLEDHVRCVLLENERGNKFYKAVEQGFASFLSGYPERGRWRRKATARHLVWEEIGRNLISLADDDDGIKPIKHRDTLSLIVEDEVLFRLKHADIGLTTRNFPTPEAQAFDDHDADLYGYKGLQRVRLCYVLNRFESQLIWVGVAAHDHGRFLWKLELDGAGAVAAPVSLPLDEPASDTARLVRLKKPQQEESEKKKRDDGQI